MSVLRVEILVDDSTAAWSIPENASFKFVKTTLTEMKKFSRSLLVSLMLFGATLQSGCYGSFALVKNVYDWNGSIEDPFVRSIVFFALNIIPVYPAAAIIDAFILNAIEFWSGSNPVSMREGQKEQQWVTYKGKNYLIEASRNRFRITPEAGGRKAVNLVFTPFNTTWNLEKDGKLIALSRIEESNGNLAVRVFGKDGRSQVHAFSGEGSMAALKSALADEEFTASR
ncbi:MAG: hypothetical protein RLZZ630_874 [Bacteroidota bacterium]